MVRESGMPDQQMWESFYDPDGVLDELGFISALSTLELGAGYGTFSVAAARRTRRFVTCELDERLAQLVRQQLAISKTPDFVVLQLDFMAELDEVSVGKHDAVLLFNILHMDQPSDFLTSLRQVLRDDALVYVIHWRSDIETPRGPPSAIRTQPEQCMGWFATAGFELVQSKTLRSAPYHFGQVFRLTMPPA